MHYLLLQLGKLFLFGVFKVFDLLCLLGSNHFNSANSVHCHDAICCVISN
jgi:hypothetical protein